MSVVLWRDLVRGESERRRQGWWLVCVCNVQGVLKGDLFIGR